MPDRVDSASLLIAASAERVFAAFRTGDTYARWLAPAGMQATAAAYDFRPGGAYDIALRYSDTDHGPGKTSADTDRATGRFVTIDPPRLIVQTAVFDSDDPAFQGEMRMTWAFIPAAGGTRVTITATNVPPGISAAEHQKGLTETLANLADFVAGDGPR